MVDVLFMSRYCLLSISCFRLTRVDYDATRPQAYPTDLLRTFLTREVYAEGFTWDSEKNWRSSKVRLPVILQDIVLEVAEPVVRKNKASFKDFKDRLKKRLSSTNTPATVRRRRDKKVREDLDTKEARASVEEALSDADEEQTSHKKQPAVRAGAQARGLGKESMSAVGVSGKKKIRGSRQQVDDEDEESDGACPPPPRKVRTPGTQDASSRSEHEDEEQEERRLARKSVQAYYRRQAHLMSQRGQDKEEEQPYHPSEEELLYSSDEY